MSFSSRQTKLSVFYGCPYWAGVRRAGFRCIEGQMNMWWTHTLQYGKSNREGFGGLSWFLVNCIVVRKKEKLLSNVILFFFFALPNLFTYRFLYVFRIFYVKYCVSYILHCTFAGKREDSSRRRVFISRWTSRTREDLALSKDILRNPEVYFSPTRLSTTSLRGADVFSCFSAGETRGEQSVCSPLRSPWMGRS